ncbi:MAG: CARDB domain-containing protein, partial [Kangiellaceae bacterium]|nr:CARDB domain-containing protein [Kangiellaceae bacterium]
SDQVIEINETNNGGSGSRNVVECKPDLVVGLCHDNLTVSPIDPLDGGNVTYSAEIRNNGQIANSTGFTVLFQVDSPGGISSYTQVFNGTLNPFNSTIISVNAPLAPVDSELTVFVDSNDDIDENSEANNTAGSIELCHEFRLQRPGPNQFWQDDTFFQFENVVPNINLRAFNAYTASAVDVKFEVSGPGIPAILDLGTVTINNVNECDEPPTGYPVFLPTSFVFNELGTYTFTFTVDPDNDYLECDDTNNVYTRDVEVESLSDMRTLSEFINPSLLNPDVNEPVTLDITYENLGFQNVADEMDLKVFVNEVEIATIQNVPGLLTDTNNTVTVPVPFQSNIPGANVVKVFIDSENEIVELNEDNNEAT